MYNILCIKNNFFKIIIFSKLINIKTNFLKSQKFMEESE